MIIPPSHHSDPGASQRPRRVVIVNAKGGCGKTTLATTIAAWYARGGRSTCLVDMDPQGSSTQWLESRPAERPPIAGVWTHQRMTAMTRSFALRLPLNTERLVIDTPAGLDRGELATVVRDADAVVVPVLPSAFDIRAASRSIADILLAIGKLRQRQRIAVVANRVRDNTRVYDRLVRFLDSLTIPFITSLRNTQYYAIAADQGLGIHELDEPRVRHDKRQWRPLLDWIENDPGISPDAVSAHAAHAASGAPAP